MGKMRKPNMREAILRTLEMVDGSTTRAAEVLGISVRKIQYRLKEFAGQSGLPAHTSHPPQLSHLACSPK